jgi:hypothetical protein
MICLLYDKHSAALRLAASWSDEHEEYEVSRILGGRSQTGRVSKSRICRFPLTDLESHMVNLVRCAAAFLLSGIWLCAAPEACAADSWQPVTADELSMTSEPKAPGAPAIYLYRQVDRNDGDGHHEFNYLRIKVLTDEGRKYADVEIPFVRERQKIRGIKARTIQPDGSIAEFNGTTFEQTIVKGKGVKYLAKTFTIPDVHVGTIIDYAYDVELNEDWVYDSQWILSGDLFTKKAKFSLKPAGGLGLRWSWPAGLPEGTSPPTKQGGEVHLESQNIPAFQTEDYMPPESALKCRVEFIYESGAQETDPAKFWKRYGKNWYEWFNSFVDKKKTMEQAVGGIVASGDSPEVKLQKIYARVLQVRNLSFEKEKTEQEAKRDKQQDVHNVEEVWRLGYGNARQVNWLFIALARAAGIDADCVYVSARNSYFFDQRMLNPAELDADVVLVKLQGKDLYLDPGAKFAAFGILPWYETQVAGMALDKDGGKWVQTSLLDSSAAKTERKADLTLSEDGTLEGKLTVTYGGIEALDLRTEESDEDDASRKTTLEGLVKEAVPVAIEVELTNKPDWTTASPTLVAEYHLKVPGWVSGAGRRALFPMGLFSGNEKHVFEHAARIYPVYFHNPYLTSDEVSVTLPLGWKVASVPAPVNRSGNVIGYVLKADNDAGGLHITRTLRDELVWLEKEKYGALRSFFQEVRTGDEQQVVLQPIS